MGPRRAGTAVGIPGSLTVGRRSSAGRRPTLVVHADLSLFEGASKRATGTEVRARPSSPGRF